MTDTPTNTKRGWSSYCQRDQHTTCKAAKARCTCSCHGRQGQEPPTVRAPRPVDVPVSRRPAAPQPSKEKAMPTPVEKIGVQLIKKEPPPKRTGFLTDILKAITAIDEDDTDWYQVCVLASASGAGAQRNKLKEDPEAEGFEFQARKHDLGSALFVRRTE